MVRLYWLAQTNGAVAQSTLATPWKPVSGIRARSDVELSRAGSRDETFDARAGEATLTLHFAAEPGTEVITGLAPGRNPARKVPVLVVRRRARSTIFDVRHEVSARER